MSGEFSWVDSAYMHNHIQEHAENCSDPHRQEPTQILGELLTALSPIAHWVCWNEAFDSSVSAPIMSMIKQRDALGAAVERLDKYLQPFRDLQEQAIRDALVEDPLSRRMVRRDA